MAYRYAPLHQATALPRKGNSAQGRITGKGAFHLLCGTAHNKWNPIEHRLFSAISRNWAGRPLDSWETILNYISTTTTRTGLQVRSVRVRQEYQTGVKITKQQMAGLKLVRSENLPQWNYDIHPRKTDSESELSPSLAAT